jgi:two-component system, sensor histidine kinase and response regulator
MVKLQFSELAKAEFDLVLMDVQMPNMDGFEATAAIRERERENGGRIPIVGLTAHALKGYEQRCLAAGMDAYISKPVHARELVEVIEALVQKSDDKTIPENARAASQV